MKKRRKLRYNDGIRRLSARPKPLGTRIPRMPSFDTLSLTDADINRFWSKVQKSDECWKWTAAKINGVGVVNLNGATYSAPKISSFIAFGRKDLSGLLVSNKCGVQECVNPEHLNFISREEKIKGNSFRRGAAAVIRTPTLYESRDGSPCALIPVGTAYYALVDSEDASRLEEQNWQYSEGYAVVNKSASHPRSKMHRVILNAPRGVMVDHVNGDKLDNRKTNLRLASSSQNCLNNINLFGHNVSGKTGVSWHEQNQTWRVRIVVRGEIIEGGCFVRLEDAIRIRLELETKYCGDFAPKRRSSSTLSA